MGEASEHPPVLCVVAAFSRYAEALDWGRTRAVEAWGPLLLVSPRYDFVETDYYEKQMGADLVLELWAFERLIVPDELVERKLATNAWEEEYAALGQQAERRPLNLDPGYLTPAKLVLASTKDHSHRIYLRRGIFAEVTLHYSGGAWQARDWTYPNYRRADYHQFLTRCRDGLRQAAREGRGA